MIQFTEWLRPRHVPVWLLLLNCTLALGACRTGQLSLDDGEGHKKENPLSIHTLRAAREPAPKVAGTVVIPARTPELSGYPCMEQCHIKRPPNPTRRELTEFHTLKRVDHGDNNGTMWCGLCHDLEDADRLRLLSGDPLSFDEAPTLCGQCHGDKKRDWDAGIHGLQTGHFRGDKERRSCTACHDPHAPARPPFISLPPPNLRAGVP